jgi:hypothetical protein
MKVKLRRFNGKDNLNILLLLLLKTKIVHLFIAHTVTTDVE